MDSRRRRLLAAQAQFPAACWATTISALVFVALSAVGLLVVLFLLFVDHEHDKWHPGTVSGPLPMTFPFSFCFFFHLLLLALVALLLLLASRCRTPLRGEGSSFCVLAFARSALAFVTTRHCSYRRGQ